MADVPLFHHSLGLTPDVIAFAEDLRGHGHDVHTPDLYDGRTFDTLDAGLAYFEQIGVDGFLDRGARAAADSPAALVYLGFFLDEGDADAAHALVDQASDAELHLYPGDEHLFADSSLPSYDAKATAQSLERTLAFLGSR
ncbi:dienelactone hydrolase family protein [Nonomuraea glycinis]|uniref:dienelactone hydrolase family protein n=1 Tax=Nonomuraea glycinis TaxID=2047744 RepID=UPI0033B16804